MSQKERGGIPRFFVCQILWVGVGKGVGDFCNPLSIPVYAGFNFSKVRQKKKKKKSKSLVKTSLPAGSRCDSKFVKQMQNTG